MEYYGVMLGCSMVLLCLIYNLSSTAKYYLKFSILAIAAFLWTTISLPFMFLRPRDPRNALFPSWLFRNTARAIGISWEVRGLENIDNTQGCVVLLNHQSSLDLLIFTIIWRFMNRGTTVSKNLIFYLWPFGLATWLWGTVFIDRKKKGQAMDSINKQAEAVKRKKAKLFIFPEATRNSKDELLPFKKGAFHASLIAESPIQPVVVSKYHFIDHAHSTFQKGHFIISILPLIETTNYTTENLDELVAKTRNLMQATFTETSKETLPLNSKSKTN